MTIFNNIQPFIFFCLLIQDLISFEFKNIYSKKFWNIKFLLYLCERKIYAMRVVSHRKLKEFYTIGGHADAQSAIERWYSIVEDATWNNFADIRRDFPDVDYVGNQHYVFNIKGNGYRLVVVVKFSIGCVFIRFIGTHAEYDVIDCSTI